MPVDAGMTFQIGERTVGAECPCFVIAEAGVNHNGDLRLAHQLIDTAADAGADAVKFQTFDPAALVSDDASAAPYQQSAGAIAQRQMLDALVLPKNAWPALATHAADAGLVFMSTAFDVGSLALLLELHVQALKIPSGEVDHLELVTATAACGVPVIVSTGLATLDEVAAAVDAASAAPGVAVLHCVTAYPARVESSNLRCIQTMAARFRRPVGWSDHTLGYQSAVAAIALGASILEKHFTMDRSLPGPDHSASADPAELRQYIAAVRAVQTGLGDGIKRPSAAELENRVFVRRSHHAARELHPGDVLRKEDTRLLRPATGIPPAVSVCGRTVTRTILAGEPVTADDLQ